MYLLSQLQQVMTTRKSVHLKRVMKVMQKKNSLKFVVSFYQPDTFKWQLYIDRGNFHTKPKSINFAKFKRKRTPERLFPLQNAFFNSRTLPNGFERFFNACLTLFERFFPQCSERQKPLRCFFSTQSPKINLFWVWS